MIVRAYLSNYSWFVVHFFDARQRKRCFAVLLYGENAKLGRGGAGSSRLVQNKLLRLSCGTGIPTWK